MRIKVQLDRDTLGTTSTLTAYYENDAGEFVEVYREDFRKDPDGGGMRSDGVVGDAREQAPLSEPQQDTIEQFMDIVCNPDVEGIRHYKSIVVEMD